MLLFSALTLLAATPGLDTSAIDKSIAPGDNFFQHANGAWLKANAIPDDRSSWGVGAALVEQAQKQTVELIQTAADAGTPEGRKVADAYASYMDEAGIEAKGVKPIKPKVDAALALKDKTALAKALGAQVRADVDPLNATNFETRHLFGVFVAQALEDPSTNRAYLLQGGLGMPDREYYVDGPARSSSPVVVRRVAAPDTSLVEPLGDLLIDAVHSGASIGFLAPVSRETADRYWHEVFASLGVDRLLWVAEKEGVVVGTVQLSLCDKDNGRHRAEVQKLLVLRSARGNGVATLLMGEQRACAGHRLPVRPGQAPARRPERRIPVPATAADGAPATR